VLTRLVGWVVDRPRRVLAGVGVLFVAGIVLGGPVAGLMTSDVAAPHAPDVVATNVLAAASGVDVTPDAVLLVRAGSSVTSGPGASLVAAVVARVERIPGVATVDQPAAGPTAVRAGLVSRDGRSALVVAHYRSSVDPDPVSKRILAAFGPRSDVLIGGDEIATLEINNDVSADLARAELIVFPVLLLLGFWIFRGLVAALVPLAIGAVAIVAALLGLRVVNSFDLLSSYVLNLMIGLGLGLSIDYSLFVISRYREEAATAGYTRDALVAAVARSGRTVAFSAMTVTVAMASLLVFPQRFLYSMGVGGVLVTLLAMLCSVTVLPAILALLGERINKLSPSRWRRTGEREAVDASASVWYRVAHLAMRRPALTLAAALIVVGVAVSPALSVHFSNVDATSLPVSAPAHQVDSLIVADFPGGTTSQLQVVLSAPATAGSTAAALRARIAARPEARYVAAPRYVGTGTWEIDVTTAAGPYTASSRHLVKAIDAIRSPQPILLAGDSAAFVNLEQSMLSRLPIALVIVAVTVLAIILALTGSIVLAIKTLVFNALNVAAVLGVLVWIFERGHLEGLLGFHSIGTLDLTQPILVLVISFGLSTDYGVFLLSRIKEEHDRSGLLLEARPGRRGAHFAPTYRLRRDGAEPIALGLARTGRIISSAALLLFVAIGAFSTSSILFIKEIGVGSAIAVLLDATLVRAFLVPATMRLFGRANWWSPRPFRAMSGRLRRDEPAGPPSLAVAPASGSGSDDPTAALSPPRAVALR
jgi:uncharacterized membrane protein YdfJ with MMPL/SSD domain